MNKIKFLTLLLLSVLIIPIFSIGQVYGADLVTEQYDVNIKVYEDYSWDVEEIIQMNFLTKHHGIFRYIPYKGNIYYNYQGEERRTPYKIKFKNVEIPHYKYDKYNENSNIVFKIGDGNIYLEGLNIYSIFYKAEAYQKPTEGFEQFYWGILPNEWNAAIEKGSFTIEMPKPVKEENIEFIAGPYGSAYTDWVDWTLEGDKTIIGRLNRGLEPGEGVTLRVVMEEGYFQGARNHNWMFYPMVFLVFLGPILCFYLWRRFGVDPPLVKTVEFYPPDGLDPAQASFIIDGSTDSKDIVGLIIYLADKGYLTIEENGKNFTMFKNKDMPSSANKYLKTIFNGLFPLGDEATEKELGAYFASSAILAQKEVRNYYKTDENHRLFTRESMAARVISLLLAILPIFAVGVFGIGYNYGTWDDIGVVMVFISVLLPLYLFHMYNFDKRNTMKRFKRFIYRGSSGILTFLLLAFIMMYFDEREGLFFWGVGAVAFSLISLIFTMLMKKRTPYGSEMLGKILGFKEFLKVAEVDRIKLLVEENPSYFYGTLPYAYVFGLTRVWAKKFEKITMESPSWYSSATGAAFSYNAFMKSFSNYANTIDKVSIPKSSGGSSGGGGSYSGGGGSSGGGMGGGGGGGW